VDDVDPDLAAIGAEIRRHRKAQRLSQEVLAERAGLHRNHIGYIERGERKVTVLTLIQVARALKVAPAVLMAPVS
jgi:transcriptional regulator with XRE-family HTH domain